MPLETGRDGRAGLVLAGGRSRRFGEADKAVADLAGTPMIRRVVDLIRPTVDELVISCREEQVPTIRSMLEDEPDASFAVDPVDDRGPVAGIVTGLRSVTAADAVVVGCDMPFVDPTFVEFLFDRAAGYEAAVPRLDDGWFQVTQAVYRVEPMADACERALARGDRRIVDPLSDLDYVAVDEDEIREHAGLETFENVNTRREFEAVARRLEEE